MSIFAEYLATRPKSDPEDSDSEGEAVETSDSEEADVPEAERAPEAEQSESSSEPPVLPLNKNPCLTIFSRV